MPVVGAALTSFATTTDATSFTTSSITPTGNSLVIAAFLHAKASAVVPTSVVGCGLTWVMFANNDLGVTNRKLTLWRALGAAPVPGAVTVDFSGVLQDACGWVLVEFANVIQAGTNGSGAIIQVVDTASGNDPSPTTTLAAFSSPDNATYGAFGVANTSGFTAGSGFAELGDVNAAGVGSLMAEWVASNDTSVDATCTSGTWGAVGVEIGFATPGIVGNDFPGSHRIRSRATSW